MPYDSDSDSDYSDDFDSDDSPPVKKSSPPKKAPAATTSKSIADAVASILGTATTASTTTPAAASTKYSTTTTTTAPYTSSTTTPSSGRPPPGGSSTASTTARTHTTSASPAAPASAQGGSSASSPPAASAASAAAPGGVSSDVLHIEVVGPGAGGAFRVNASDRVQVLRKILEEASQAGVEAGHGRAGFAAGMALDRLSLLHGGAELKDDMQSLAGCGIRDGSTVALQEIAAPPATPSECCVALAALAAASVVATGAVTRKRALLVISTLRRSASRKLLESRAFSLTTTSLRTHLHARGARATPHTLWAPAAYAACIRGEPPPPGLPPLPPAARQMRAAELQALCASLQRGELPKRDAFSLLCDSLYASAGRRYRCVRSIPGIAPFGVVVVGDLRGDLSALNQILSLEGATPDTSYIFNGGFGCGMDGGDGEAASLCTVLCLAALSLLAPEHVHLTRGCGEVSSAALFEAASTRYGVPHSQKLVAFLTTLPLVHIVNGEVAVLHSGVPARPVQLSASDESLELHAPAFARGEISQGNTSTSTSTGLMDTRMASPATPCGDPVPAAALVDFCKSNSLRGVIRSHAARGPAGPGAASGHTVEAFPHGVAVHSIWSAPGYTPGVGASVLFITHCVPESGGGGGAPPAPAALRGAAPVPSVPGVAGVVGSAPAPALPHLVGSSTLCIPVLLRRGAALRCWRGGGGGAATTDLTPTPPPPPPPSAEAEGAAASTDPALPSSPKPDASGGGAAAAAADTAAVPSITSTSTSTDVPKLSDEWRALRAQAVSLVSEVLLQEVDLSLLIPQQQQDGGATMRDPHQGGLSHTNPSSESDATQRCCGGCPMPTRAFWVSALRNSVPSDVPWRTIWRHVAIPLGGTAAARSSCRCLRLPRHLHLWVSPLTFLLRLTPFESGWLSLWGGKAGPLLRSPVLRAIRGAPQRERGKLEAILLGVSPPGSTSSAPPLAEAAALLSSLVCGMVGGGSGMAPSSSTSAEPLGDISLSLWMFAAHAFSLWSESGGRRAVFGDGGAKPNSNSNSSSTSSSNSSPLDEVVFALWRCSVRSPAEFGGMCDRLDTSGASDWWQGWIRQRCPPQSGKGVWDAAQLRLQSLTPQGEPLSPVVRDMVARCATLLCSSPGSALRLFASLRRSAVQGTLPTGICTKAHPTTLRIASSGFLEAVTHALIADGGGGGGGGGGSPLPSPTSSRGSPRQGGGEGGNRVGLTQPSHPDAAMEELMPDFSTAEGRALCGGGVGGATTPSAAPLQLLTESAFCDAARVWSILEDLLPTSAIRRDAAAELASPPTRRHPGTATPPPPQHIPLEGESTPGGGVVEAGSGVLRTAFNTSNAVSMRCSDVLCSLTSLGGVPCFVPRRPALLRPEWRIHPFPSAVAAAVAAGVSIAASCCTALLHSTPPPGGDDAHGGDDPRNHRTLLRHRQAVSAAYDAVARGGCPPPAAQASSIASPSHRHAAHSLHPAGADRGDASDGEDDEINGMGWTCSPSSAFYSAGGGGGGAAAASGGGHKVAAVSRMRFDLKGRSARLDFSWGPEGGADDGGGGGGDGGGATPSPPPPEGGAAAAAAVEAEAEAPLGGGAAGGEKPRTPKGGKVEKNRETFLSAVYTAQRGVGGNPPSLSVTVGSAGAPQEHLVVMRVSLLTGGVPSATPKITLEAVEVPQAQQKNPHRLHPPGRDHRRVHIDLPAAPTHTAAAVKLWLFLDSLQAVSLPPQARSAQPSPPPIRHNLGVQFAVPWSGGLSGRPSSAPPHFVSLGIVREALVFFGGWCVGVWGGGGGGGVAPASDPHGALWGAVASDFQNTSGFLKHLRRSCAERKAALAEALHCLRHLPLPELLQLMGAALLATRGGDASPHPHHRTHHLATPPPAEDTPDTSEGDFGRGVHSLAYSLEEADLPLLRTAVALAEARQASGKRGGGGGGGGVTVSSRVVVSEGSRSGETGEVVHITHSGKDASVRFRVEGGGEGGGGGGGGGAFQTEVVPVASLSVLTPDARRHVLNELGHVVFRKSLLGVSKSGGMYTLGNGGKATPLHFACLAARLPTVKWLLREGADPSTPCTRSGGAGQGSTARPRGLLLSPGELCLANASGSSGLLAKCNQEASDIQKQLVPLKNAEAAAIKESTEAQREWDAALKELAQHRDAATKRRLAEKSAVDSPDDVEEESRLEAAAAKLEKSFRTHEAEEKKHADATAEVTQRHTACTRQGEGHRAASELFRNVASLLGTLSGARGGGSALSGKRAAEAVAATSATTRPAGSGGRRGGGGRGKSCAAVVTEVSDGKACLKPASLAAVAAGLEANTLPASLNLGGVCLGAEGHAEQILAKLACNTSVTELNLRGCALGPEAGLSLAKSIASNASLCALHLWSNPLGDAAVAIVEAAATRPAGAPCIRIDLTNTGMGPADCERCRGIAAGVPPGGDSPPPQQRVVSPPRVTLLLDAIAVKASGRGGGGGGGGGAAGGSLGISLSPSERLGAREAAVASVAKEEAEKAKAVAEAAAGVGGSGRAMTVEESKSLELRKAEEEEKAKAVAEASRKRGARKGRRRRKKKGARPAGRGGSSSSVSCSSSSSSGSYSSLSSSVSSRGGAAAVAGGGGGGGVQSPGVKRREEELKKLEIEKLLQEKEAEEEEEEKLLAKRASGMIA